MATMVIHYGKRLQTNPVLGVLSMVDFAFCMDASRPVGALRLTTTVSEVTCKRCLSWIKRGSGGTARALEVGDE